MNYKLPEISAITVLLLSILLLNGCEVGHRNYRYIVSNEISDSLLLTCLLNGETETQQIWMKPGSDTLIYERNGVAGDDIWNIETSPTMFAIHTLTATAKNGNTTRMTDELSQRIFWSPQPEDRNGTGVYTLQIRDSLFKLEKQPNFYLVHNAMDTTIFVISEWHEKDRSRDTIACGETAEIGCAEVFVYDETWQGTDKYIEKKLSGIRSLTVTYKRISKSIDLKKPHLYKWNTSEPGKSTLSADSTIFFN
ncbi:MAG: hypothetical protein LBR52_07165 [Prevotellaceae bacterium]|jgi:hypothetical protein|nr:hypothetical protein [Prevotellaceae bacterium]